MVSKTSELVFDGVKPVQWSKLMNIPELENVFRLLVKVPEGERELPFHEFQDAVVELVVGNQVLNKEVSLFLLSLLDNYHLDEILLRATSERLLDLLCEAEDKGGIRLGENVDRKAVDEEIRIRRALVSREVTGVLSHKTGENGRSKTPAVVEKMENYSFGDLELVCQGKNDVYFGVLNRDPVQVARGIKCYLKMNVMASLEVYDKSVLGKTVYGLNKLVLMVKDAISQIASSSRKVDYLSFCNVMKELGITEIKEVACVNDLRKLMDYLRGQIVFFFEKYAKEAQVENDAGTLCIGVYAYRDLGRHGDVVRHGGPMIYAPEAINTSGLPKAVADSASILGNHGLAMEALSLFSLRGGDLRRLSCRLIEMRALESAGDLERAYAIALDLPDRGQTVLDKKRVMAKFHCANSRFEEGFKLAEDCLQLGGENFDVVKVAVKCAFGLGQIDKVVGYLLLLYSKVGFRDEKMLCGVLEHLNERRDFQNMFEFLDMESGLFVDACAKFHWYRIGAHAAYSNGEWARVSRYVKAGGMVFPPGYPKKVFEGPMDMALLRIQGEAFDGLMRREKTG